MDSAWSPRLWYVGFRVLPPAYPTRVRTTPGRLPNRESGPQNQPRVNVAISVTVGAAASIGGAAAPDDARADGPLLFSPPRSPTRTIPARMATATPPTPISPANPMGHSLSSRRSPRSFPFLFDCICHPPVSREFADVCVAFVGY